MQKPTRRHEYEGDELRRVWAAHEVEDDIRYVEAALVRDEREWPWHVTVAVAEFLREEPLETEFTDAVSAALRKVRGVRDVVQEDREVWLVAGRFVSGKALVAAVDAALERLDATMREHVDSLF